MDMLQINFLGDMIIKINTVGIIFMDKICK